MHIIIATHGFVFAGDVTDDDQKCVHLSRPFIVRRWGTETGLGHLAMHGPTKDTILDPLPEGTAVADVIATLPCDSEIWSPENLAAWLVKQKLDD